MEAPGHGLLKFSINLSGHVHVADIVGFLNNLTSVEKILT